MEFDLGQFVVSLLQLFTVTLLVWSIFRYPVAPEPPVNRQIAMALGLAKRDTIFEMPVLRQLMGIGVLLGNRFPFFRGRIRQDLEASGNPLGYSVDEYLAMCLASAVVMTALSTLLLLAKLGQFDLLIVLVMPVVGFAVPMWTLHGQASKRTRAIGKKLPYTLDLIALLMEAGATFPEAITTLIKDEPDDEFNRELALVQAEIDFGTTRAAALANMADRIPLDALRSVVGAVNQAEALGTPLSTILKNQSGMIRMLRTVRAEEASASASLRILIPSMLILLAVVIVVFSPIILRWWEKGIFAQ
jgi:tight adherence protein C